MPSPIPSINALIGDLSFVARHGRAPTAADDQTDRIATHLAFAERVLRAARVPHLTAAQRAGRAELLDRLAVYIAARRFPLPEARGGRLPAFVDRDGQRCAVAALVDHVAGARAAPRIDARFHADFVGAITDPLLDAVANDGGVSRAELALIQPTYQHMPPAPPHEIQWQAAVIAAVAVDSDAAHDDRPARALAAGGVRWLGGYDHRLGEPIVALDGEVGVESGVRAPYALSARIGTELLWSGGRDLHDCEICLGNRTGILAGVRVDADGARVPRAWTVPIDAYWYVPWFGSRVAVGATGGVRVRFAGADRALGWTAGVDVALPQVARGMHWSAPQDAHLGLAVERLGDLTLFELTVGFTSRDRYDQRESSW